MALKKIDSALHQAGVFLHAGESIWEIRDIDRLARLYEFIKEEQKKTDGGIFCNDSAPSYWKKGFCSAAVKDFSKFLSLADRQKIMLEQFANAGAAKKLAQDLEKVKLKPNPLLIPDDISVTTLEGKSILKEIKIRQNQSVFRKMILSIYQGKCCLTGLPIQEVLRASHISAWATDLPNRMNPENGLCLSATYDAAFDRHLISFDDDYRMILAPSLHEYCTNQAFQEQFKHFEGARITLPIRFFPSKELLAKHREAMQ